jgi:heterodisulfide reductase subunit A
VDNTGISVNSIKPAVLVVGGGIAGMQAALEVASSEHQVYLVERTPTVGGHMLQLDKTFPTLDCASCIGTPKMSQVGSNKYIDLMTNSEVVKVSGCAGDFRVTIRKKSQYVDIRQCTGCGECTEVCPVSVPSEWDIGLSKRKAIYRPFPQAVPNAFTIDKRGYPPCRATCPAGVNAQGYIALISQGKFKEALEVLRRTMPFAGVCGRVCNHSCEGECERGKIDEPIDIHSLKRFMADYDLKVGREKQAPITPIKKDRVAIVGSGPAGIACAYDLIREGYPVTVFEAAPQTGGLLRYGIPEYRLPKKIVDEEISYVQELGVEIKTNTPIQKLEDVFNQGYKAIFVAVGCQASMKLGITNDNAEGVIYVLDFLNQVNSGSKASLGNRVVIIGGGSVAIDAARVSLRLGAKEVHLVCLETRDLTCKDRMPAQDIEIEEAEEEGIIIHPSLGPKEVLTENGNVVALNTMVCTSVRTADGRFAPTYGDGPAPTIAADTIIIAAGQMPERAIFNELEKTPRGTFKADGVTLQTNIEGVFAGGDIVSGPVNVIAAVAAGKEAAISIGRYLTGANLKEGRAKQRERVQEVNKAGVEIKSRQSMPVLEPEKRKQDFVEVELGFDEEKAITEAKRCLNCGVCSECFACVSACEKKIINHDMKDEYRELEVGAIIVATGFDPLDPTPMYQYGYKRFDNVITSLEMERYLNATGPTQGRALLKDGSTPKSVAIIHCVGSRDKNYHEYCSRVCCMYGLKHAHLLRERANAVVYQMYIDMRCFGKGYEEFYKRVSEEGINFIRGKVAQVTDVAISDEEKGKLIVVCEDTLLGAMIRVPVDMVILNVAVEPRSDAAEVARIFGLQRSIDSFFSEKNYELDTMGTLTDGIFMAGCCQGPKDIPDTVAQAIGAAGKALALVAKGEVGEAPKTELAEVAE